MADVRIDDVALRRILTHPDGIVLRDTWRRGKRVEAKAKRKCPVDHGRLRSSIHTEFVLRGGAPFVRVGTNVRYAEWVHNGTGLYGPHKKVITPKSGKVLVFTRPGGWEFDADKEAKRSAKWKGKIVVRSVKGMKGRPFLKEALDAVNDE